MAENNRPLSHNAIRGGSITLGLQGFKFIFQLCTVAILSRLLTPAEVGIFAIAALIAGGIDLIRDFGFPQAILGQKNVSQIDFRAYTTISYFLGFSACALFIFSAPLVSSLFQESQLGLVMPVLSLVFIFNGAQTIIHARLLYEQRYFTLNLTELIAILCSTVLAILLAINGWGIWALVAQYLSLSVFLLLLRLFTKAGNFPILFSRLSNTQTNTLKNGAHIFVSNLFLYLSGNTDNSMIGVRFGAAELALYTRGFQLAMLPQLYFTGSLGAMAVGILSKIENDIRRLEIYLIRIIRALTYALVPVYIIIAGCAHSIVSLLLGSSWNQTSQLLFPLSLAGFFLAISSPITWALLAVGNTRQNLQITITTRVILMSLIVIGAFHNTVTVAWFFFIGTVLLWAIQTLWGCMVLKIEIIPFIKNGLVGLTILLGGIGLTKVILKLLLEINPWLEILVVTSATLLGLTLFFLLSKKNKDEMMQIGKKFFRVSEEF